MAEECSRPRDSRGFLGVQYTVFCGCCYEWEYVEGTRRAAAAADARRRGWRCTRARGWICPRCGSGRTGGR